MTTALPADTARPASMPPDFIRANSTDTNVVFPDFHRLVNSVTLPAARKPCHSHFVFTGRAARSSANDIAARNRNGAHGVLTPASLGSSEPGALATGASVPIPLSGRSQTGAASF